MEWHIIGILAFVVIYNLYRYYHEDNSNDYSSVSDDVVHIIRLRKRVWKKQLALSN